jgi:hypothetical protein
VWSGTTNPSVLTLDPASGTDEAGNLVTTTYNDFDNLRWLGIARGTTPIFDSAHVGNWYCVEVRARLNDPLQSNGVFEMWIDEQLDAQRTGLNWLGAFDLYGINALFLENYWNEGSPQAQERYFDNFVVSTQRIGCGSSSSGGSSSVGSVSVSLDQSSLSVTETTQATASVWDESGNELADSAVTWSSDNPLVVSVEPTGAKTALVTALLAGSANVSATVEGKSGSATVSVTTSGSPSAGYPNEPSGFSTITDRPFNLETEDGWRASSNVAGGLTITVDANALKSAPAVGQMYYPEGFDGGYTPGAANRTIASHGYTRLYLSFWVKLSSNWYGHPSKVNKIGYVWTHGDPVVYLANVGSGSGPLFSEVRIQDVPGGAVNYEANLAYLEIPRDQWVRWEVVLVNNTGDNANGQIHWWINGTKVGQYTNVKFGTASQSKVWEELQWKPYWGGVDSTLPYEMFMWMDHWYTSGAP